MISSSEIRQDMEYDNKKFNQEVKRIIEETIDRSVELSSIELDISGPAYDSLIDETRARMLNVFGRIGEYCESRHLQHLLPLFRHRIGSLFALDKQLLNMSKKYGGKSLGLVLDGEADEQPVSSLGQPINEDFINERVLKLGMVYIESRNLDSRFLENVKFIIYRAFCALCDGDEQSEVLKIISELTIKDLKYVDTEGDIVIFSYRGSLIHHKLQVFRESKKTCPSSRGSEADEPVISVDEIRNSFTADDIASLADISFNNNRVYDSTPPVESTTRKTTPRPGSPDSSKYFDPDFDIDWGDF